MKKVIYTLVIAISSALIFNACTEEEVVPATENGGGADIIIVKH